MPKTLKETLKQPRAGAFVAFCRMKRTALQKNVYCQKVDVYIHFINVELKDNPGTTTFTCVYLSSQGQGINIHSSYNKWLGNTHMHNIRLPMFIQKQDEVF